MERRPLRNSEDCEPITETMALLLICANVGVVLKRWFSSGGAMVKAFKFLGNLTCSNVFLVPKSRRSSERLSEAFRLRYEARSSTLRVPKRPLPRFARRVPVPSKSDF